MNIQTIRHSFAHLLAYAVKELYPNVKFGIGPAIENGFYYDFDLKESITPQNLAKIEKRMKELIKQNIKFEKAIISKKEAKKIFSNQSYKLQLIQDIKEDEVITYKTGDFLDLCAGPHIQNTKQLNPEAFKLTKIAGAYWKGDEKNKMLQRVYGLAFSTKKELDEHIALQEEAEKRDHRILGKKLDLFVFSDLVGKGLPLFTEKGSVIIRELERFVVDEEIKRGYKHVITPELTNIELYKKSGHYPYYKESMYPIMKIDDDELVLRPMSCPHHFQLYASRPRSYKELPMRIAELAKLFRYEKSGELTGLIRVRSFCLADSHIVCQTTQAEQEINNVIDLIEYMTSILGLKSETNYHYRLSLGDRKDTKKYYKDDKSWDFAENILRKTLKDRKATFIEAKNEAAFYGPKIDIQMKNFAGKEDTAFTIQYDFVMPKRFNLTYIDKDGKEKEPIIIHRSSIGAIERTLAFLLEYYAGALPLWLSPEQIWIIPVGESYEKYAREIEKELSSFRVSVKDEKETVGKKIREGEIQKIPYLLIIGEKEIKTKSVAVRKRGKGDLGLIKLSKFKVKILEELKDKK